jgi:hypothetical protein
MKNEPSQHADSRGPAEGPLTLPQIKGVRQRNKTPVYQHSKNPTPKQGSWWTTKADLLNLRIACKLKLTHLTEGVANQAGASGRQKKKPLPNHLARP